MKDIKLGLCDHCGEVTVYRRGHFIVVIKCGAIGRFVNRIYWALRDRRVKDA